MADALLVKCTYCSEEISGVRVQCCECVDFVICLQCFGSGAEIGDHKHDHSYRLIEPCPGGVFGGKDNWTGYEELQLLEAMDLCGFGSWEYVSKQIKTRTPEEVKEKYMTRYFDGKIGRATWDEIGDCRPMLIDHTPMEKGPLASEVVTQPPIDVTPEEAAQLGYLAYLNYFEWDYDNEAEGLVSKLQLKINEDTHMEKALKLAQIDMYTRRLRERSRRKRLVQDYQLVAKFFADARNKDRKPDNLTDNQRDFRYKMRIYSQFLSSGEHERLIENLEKEKELRHRLSELLKYRSLGLTTQDEIVHYEQHAAFQHKQHAHNRKTSGSCYNTTEEPYSENGNGELALNSTSHDGSLSTDAHSSSSCSCSQLDNSSLSAITTLPQANKLSLSELQFCTILSLLPVHYRMLKCIIIIENLNSGGKRRKLDESLCNGNDEPPTIKDIITEYLRVCGWLPTLSIE